ncbi:MAG: RNA polymerase-associated protein RapA [Pseudomonadales bacterium]
MSRQSFTAGQRWVSDSEPELGLGMVVEAENRRVRIFFPTSGEDRTYTMNDAPLSRVRYEVGDVVEYGEGETASVTDVDDDNGICIYHLSTDRSVVETQIISGTTRFPSMERLMRGRWDRASWFRMRRDVSQMLPKVEESPVRGLVGPRVTPVRHQLHIAHSLGQRHAPRVLLADEVGLGKTIEAGLIIHQQLLTGRASRVLILVPDSLVHQWLVEMRRRFNLMFSIIDESSFADTDENPFLGAQQVLCPLSLISGDLDHLQAALAVDWDLLVVDEAHHIEWQEEGSPWEYSCVEQLTIQARGLLLLTATPEQMGEESHFGRLRLLDPARYGSFAEWQREEQQFRQVNEILKALEGGDEPSFEALKVILSEDELTALDQHQGQERLDWLYDTLLDRHGTGRVMFRNTRKVIADLLPGRTLESYPLNGDQLPPEALTGFAGLTPEKQLGEGWIESDPRSQWLLDFLKTHKREKVLVIAQHRETVEELESWLTLRHGVRAGAFHEGLSLINRDRAAAWFADEEDGAQVLLCSEIGSEGRNFQFACHLVMFDLPGHPDLLEQRIGRLDRIGQSRRVTVHVPYFECSAGEALFNVYDEGLSAFVSTSAANGIVFQSKHDEISALLNDPMDLESGLIEELQREAEAVRERLADGRDCLLERSSHQPEQAQKVVDEVDEQDDDPELELWLLDAFDRFGIESEKLSERIYLIRPTGHRMIEQLSSLTPEGLSGTFDREIALAREDVEWLTWEHPLVIEFIELLTSGDYGTAQAAVVKHPDVAAGTILLECFFKPLHVAPKALQVARFAPMQPLRVVLKNGEVWSDPVSSESIDEHRIKLDRKPVQAVVEKLTPQLKRMIKVAGEFAEADISAECVDAAYDAEDFFNQEIERLESLRLRNPSIRQDEVDALIAQRDGVVNAINAIDARLDSVRFVLAT